MSPLFYVYAAVFVRLRKYNLKDNHITIMAVYRTYINHEPRIDAVAEPDQD